MAEEAEAEPAWLRRRKVCALLSSPFLSSFLRFYDLLFSPLFCSLISSSSSPLLFSPPLFFLQYSMLCSPLL
jgi:hypothetical protein